MSKNNSAQASLYSVFRDELAKKLPGMIHTFNLLQTQGDESVLREFRLQVYQIAGEAKVIQLRPIVEFCQSLDEYLGKLSNKELKLSSSVYTAVTTVFECWKSLINCDTNTWDESLERQTVEYKAAMDRMASSEQQVQTPYLTKSFLLNPEGLYPEISAEEDQIIDPSIYDLFKIEVQNQTSLLSAGLLDFEKSGKDAETVEGLMRAAHSIKGAAKILHLDPLVHLSHAIEDCFVAIQKNNLCLDSSGIDILLQSVDLLTQVINIPQENIKAWLKNEVSTFEKILAKIKVEILIKKDFKVHSEEQRSNPQEAFLKNFSPEQKKKNEPLSNRVLRVTAYNLNKLMGLAGESLVESRWLQPFSTSLVKIKKMTYHLALSLDNLRVNLFEKNKSREYLEDCLAKLQREINDCSSDLSNRLTELDMFMLRHSRLSDRLYREAVDIRMRPFADVLNAFPRFVRDLSKELNKIIRLEISGKFTQVDRDILEILETPLNHLVKNAVDHGIEFPDQRVKAGKPPEGTIKIEAAHRAGMLSIQISDDGRGIDPEELRKLVVEQKFVQPEIAAKLTREELLEFIFLPGFSTKKHLSEISGRGVGMNAVSTIVHGVGGSVRIQTDLGSGTTVHMMLPLTLSVLRALIVEMADEPYAFPLAKIDRALHVDKKQVQIIENTQYIQFEGENIGLVLASQVFDLGGSKNTENELPVVLISDHANTYGIIVDKFLGEKEIVVHEFDPFLGKIPSISAGGFLDDGNPVLIIDIEDLVSCIDSLLSKQHLQKFGGVKEKIEGKTKKRILVVDDSITVREVECRLLQNAGYEVHTAVNGVEGLNALHSGQYDLVVTDLDMPRMKGLELIRTIRSESRWKNLPVMIVSYKEREEDRLLGLEAGANYYLNKSSFHDATLLKAVVELIGHAEY